MNTTLTVDLPPFIGLVGNPTCGKTTAAEILIEILDGKAKIVETGQPLREIAMKYLGLSRDQVYTQEGKASHVDINGVNWQVRKILGDLGQKLEDLFGEEIMPYMAHRSQCVESGTLYIDPSCRKVQPWYWKRHGGIIIEIVNPLAKPSPYAFDAYDHTAVDYRIDNDALACGLPADLAREDLKKKLMKVLVQHAAIAQVASLMAAE